MKKNKLTTASGRPYSEFENSMTVCNRGPVLLQDYLLHEDMAHFNRECIPERVVHAKGTGAFGTFTVTHDITPYTKAKIFSEIGKVTKMFARFSIVGGEKRANIFVTLPISEKIFAFVYGVISCVTVKVPKAPVPLA